MGHVCKQSGALLVIAEKRQQFSDEIEELTADVIFLWEDIYLSFGFMSSHDVWKFCI